MKSKKKSNKKINAKTKKDYHKPQAELTKISLGVWGGSGSGSCLSLSTRIATSSGDKNVESLQIGQLVWTLDKNGERIVVPIIRTSKVPVLKTHQVVHLTLADGRELLASPDHPLTGSRKIRQLQVGEYYDDSRVLDIKLVPYHHSYTYDILPDGDTGYYWTDGILIGSTLHHTNLQENYHLITKVFSLVEFL